MTRVVEEIGGVRVVRIETEPAGKCEVCGKIAETRPYGRGGEEVCFRCGTSSPEAAEEARRRFLEFLDGKRRRGA